jgi:hypothetical protein
MRGKKIEVGDRFGRLTAVSEAGRNKHNHLLWTFDCDCGGCITTVGYDVRRGNTGSCGCLRSGAFGRLRREGKSRRSNVRNQVHIGDTFGELTIIAFAERGPRGEQRVVYQCSCGSEPRVALAANLKRRAGSCGCVRNEKIGALNRTHGLSNTLAYKLMRNAKRRARKRQATVGWAEELTDLVMYEALEKAKILEQLTGEAHHVDHIVPLCGYSGRKQTVCGLHIWYNLAIISAAQNLRKNRYVWPDQ